VLKEVKTARQWPDEPARLVFMDADFDLFVWIDEAGNVGRFQVGYDKRGSHRAFEWVNGRLSHYRIDSGQDYGRTSFNRTPVLVADSTGLPGAVRDGLRDSGIEQSRTSILEFVIKNLVA
jgi:hypothetical protein